MTSAPAWGSSDSGHCASPAGGACSAGAGDCTDNVVRVHGRPARPPPLGCSSVGLVKEAVRHHLACFRAVIDAHGLHYLGVQVAASRHLEDVLVLALHRERQSAPELRPQESVLSVLKRGAADDLDLLAPSSGILAMERASAFKGAVTVQLGRSFDADVETAPAARGRQRWQCRRWRQWQQKAVLLGRRFVWIRCCFVGFGLGLRRRQISYSAI